MEKIHKNRPKKGGNEIRETLDARRSVFGQLSEIRKQSSQIRTGLYSEHPKTKLFRFSDVSLLTQFQMVRYLDSVQKPN